LARQTTLPLSLIKPGRRAVESAHPYDPFDLLADVLTLDRADPTLVEIVEPQDTLIDRAADCGLGCMRAERDEIVNQAANARLRCLDVVGCNVPDPTVKKPVLAKTL
jgi:hypothetical protein